MQYCTMTSTRTVQSVQHYHVLTRNSSGDELANVNLFYDNIAHVLQKSCFVPSLGGLRGNVHGSPMACWKARGRLPISANCTFFASSHG